MCEDEKTELSPETARYTFGAVLTLLRGDIAQMEKQLDLMKRRFRTLEKCSLAMHNKGEGDE